MIKFKDQFDMLRELKVGWDGYDADIPLPEIINRALLIFVELQQNGLTPYKIGPSGEGGVAFNFIGARIKRAWIDILNSGEIYTVLYDTEGTCNTIEWPDNYQQEIPALAKQIKDYLL
jgi:hypothetical protein